MGGWTGEGPTEKAEREEIDSMTGTVIVIR